GAQLRDRGRLRGRVRGGGRRGHPPRLPLGRGRLRARVARGAALSQHAKEKAMATEETVEESLQLIHRHVGRAVEAVAGDAGASPVLRAVLAEFARKADKA